MHFCPYTPLILVGLKSDLRYKKSCIDMLKSQGLTPVTPEQGMAVAKKMGAQYMECSSKEMKGVEEVFERAILTVVANDRKTLEAEAAASGKKGKDIGITYTSDGVPIPIVKKKKRKCALV
jgi:Ras family.